MKGFILLFSLLMVALVSAEDITILNLHYSYGEITLKDQLIKEGYYPDRNINEGNYQILVVEGVEKLYNFNFELPNLLYSDGGSSENITGEVKELEEFDFSLVVPYYPEADKIVIASDGNELLEIENLKESKNYYWLILVSFLVIIFLVYVIIRKRRNALE